MNSYFSQTQFVAQVDEQDQIVAKVEKWHAHQQGILHRAFTIALYHQGNILLQQRKHPAFDSFFDTSISSHQIYVEDKLQDDLTAIDSCLRRELNLSIDQISSPIKKGSVLYKAQDSGSSFTEHELCYLYSAKLKDLPQFSYEYAYGYVLIPPQKLLDQSNPIHASLAPWVKEFITQNLV